MNQIAEKVAQILLELNAVTLNVKEPYRYASGMVGPVYIDNRILMSYPKERQLIRDLYIDAIKATGEQFDLIAATATAGIPHAAWIADKTNLPMVYVRSNAKDHGKGNKIEGLVKKGQVTAVIEDLVTTGESAVTTAEAVKKAGGEVTYIFAIITYGMKRSEENFEINKLKLIALSNFNDVIETAEKLGKITKNEKDIIFDWFADPISWGKKMGFE